ncbi:MAG: hypothetical protein HY700_00410 [Gemmatimonadetes bacterium]|nr:hypothetical protein [Gemmatimonadota bacterium]
MRAPGWHTMLAALVLFAGELRAQEVQVPLDEAGRIQVVTAELARRLGLFGDVDGFREARLFQLPTGDFVLEITATPRGALQRERRPLTTSEAAAFRHDLTERVTARAPSAVLDQGGRTKLLVGATILGLGYYAPATMVALDPDDSQSAVAIYMLTAAGSFIVPFLATKNRALPDAVATMALWGAMRGPIHGLLVSELGDTDSDETKLAWTVLVGATEAVVAGVAAQSLAMTPGRAELTGAGGDIGLGSGWSIGYLLGLNDRQRTVTVSQPGGNFTYRTDDRTLHSAVTLTGVGIGLAGGYLMDRSEEWTRGDATVLRNVTLLGSLAGVALGDIVHQPRLVTETYPGGSVTYYEDEFSRIHAAGALAGTAAGVAVGRVLVKGRNFTTGQGTLLTLAPLAGGLLGLGLAYLATPERTYNYVPGGPYRDPNDHSELYLVASALGAGVGFAALYPAMARQARGSTALGNLEFSVNPLAPAHLLGRGRNRVPLLSLQYRF